MKNRIVLIAISVNYDYVLTRHYYKLPSLGIGYLAAVLERKGYTVNIIDKTITPDGVPGLVREITACQPDLAGFYCISETFKLNVQIMKKLKETAPTIVTAIGGPQVYGLPKESMDHACIDYAFLGEAEESFLRFLETGMGKGRQIPGLIYRSGTEVVVSPLALVADLDSLPFPARHLYPDLRNYRPSILAYKRLPATGIITSRGCAHKCIFCHSGKGHFKLRFHSADYVLAEIEMLRKDYGINELIIFDDTFLINQSRAAAICEGMLRKGIDLTWSCNARINNLNPELLNLMKRAGCWLVQIGVESGNQRILDTINKGITLDQVEKACTLAQNAGVQIKTYFILGHPGETVTTLDETIAFMTKLPAHYAAINFMTPLPGTELWETAEQYGSFDKNKLESINYLSDRPAFIPTGLTEEILRRKMKEAYRRFYCHPATIARNLMTINSIEDIKKLWAGAMILLKLLVSAVAIPAKDKNPNAV